VLTRDGDVSVATIDVALEEQPALWDDAWIAVDGTRIASVEMPDFQRMRLRGFLDEQLRFSRYVFPPGDFPSLDWERPAMIHNQMGPLELGVTFYDAEMNPVEAAERPGRYGAVAEATGPDGYTVRRYITLYCCPEEWQEEQIDVSPERVEPLGISGELWAEHRTAIADFLGAQLTRSLGDARESAVFWAGLSELPASLPSGSFEADPWHRDRQWWVTFKRRQSGADLKYPAIDRPLRRGVTRGHVLTEGDPAAVGYQEEHLAAIRRACEDWVQAAAQPMAILVARRGTIVLHEAFGVRDDGEPMSVTTPTWMASITKLLTGCLMMQLVDEGLVCLDDPVADYLPEFERRAVTPVTVRHLFTHTSGLHAADSRGDHDMNPSLENMMGHYLPYVRAAEEQRYTGAGYAVAGKLMERVVGLAVPHLSQRLLLGPLGCTDTQVAGTGGDCMSTCLDMARVGQMLLNRGSYGEHEFFSESTFAQMLPVPVSELVPDMERGEWGATHWGIGLMSAGGTVLSDEAFTHAAASGAILIVDPPRDLVLVCCRNRKGPQYSEFNRRLVEVCVAPVAGVDRQ